jgi:hypothetical protein
MSQACSTKTLGAEFVAEFEWEGRPERPILRRAIRHRLRRFDPTIRVIAEGFLAEASAVDLLAVGGEGEIISIRIGRGGDDVALFTQALADLTWLRPRLADFLKLAPGLGLEPSAPPRAMLFCPDFARETRAAVEHFPARSIELLTYRCLRQHGQLSVLLETWNPSRARSHTVARPSSAEHDDEHDDEHDADLAARQASAAPTSLKPAQPRADPLRPSGFRTGLTDADLRIEEVEEEKVFD